MNIEHVAFNVADPVKVADWYGRHLGLKVVRKMDVAPHIHFLVDESGRVVLEFYKQTAPVPDYASMDPMVLHIAFMAKDVAGERARLIAAGGTEAGEIVTTPAGDVMTFVRDPWGLAVQLVQRAKPLL